MKKLFIAFCLSLGVSLGGAQAQNWNSSQEVFQEIEALKAQIVAPEFRDVEYAVTDFGAVGDGVTLNTEAINKAIETCSAEGGGKVVVKKGIFLTGALFLKSNVNLHLEEGSVLLFSRDTDDYPIVFTRWEGMECMNYSPLIYAYEQENIAITGAGTLDGNADNDNWWFWSGKDRFGYTKERPGVQKPARDKLHEMMAARIPVKERVFGDGHYLRPNFIQPYKSKNIWIQGVTMTNSPMWNINPVLCENVIVEDVKIDSHGPNNDGCNPEASKNVWIKGCYFDTGDDCIAIKSGRDQDGRDIGVPAENIIVENSIMKDGHGGVVIGSEIAGGAKNVYALNNIMDSPHLDRALRIKTSSSRGGVIENVFMYNTKIGRYKEAAIRFNMFYENPGKHVPTIRNIWVENMEVQGGGKYAVLSEVYESSPVDGLVLKNCVIDGVEIPYKVDHLKNVKLENVLINGKSIDAFSN
ncbi:MAG TPA: glycoside hydrolase family 28 protein [Candidatus Sphingobacterium stercoripullorum]|nr:glycoside hydrolase family 28 protein [Candidatus Sphingobacterium stercoripullorum]